MEEIWKPIKGYESYYEVSSFGRVRSICRVVSNKWGSSTLRKSAILRPYCKKYPMVVLARDGKTKNCLIHRLVAEAFIPNPNHYPVVNHIDENKANNHVGNLEWCTQKYNINYGTSLKMRGATQSITRKGRHYSPKTEFKPGNISPSLLHRVMCVETGVLYDSVKEACKDCGLSRSSVLKSYKNNKTIKGFTFKFVPKAFAGEQNTGF